MRCITFSQSLGELGINTQFLQQIRPLIIKYLDLLQWSSFLICLGQRRALQSSRLCSAANIFLVSLFSIQVFLISSLRVFFLGSGSITTIKSLIFWSWDLLSSSSKIIGLTFFGGKITQSRCRRRLLLALVGATPGRRLRASKIVALVLSLQVITKLNQERNSAQQTQRQFNYFIVIKVQRFLQSVIILNSYLVPYSLGRHSFSALTIARSSLLYILQLYLGAKCLAKKNATSLSLLLLLA